MGIEGRKLSPDFYLPDSLPSVYSELGVCQELTLFVYCRSFETPCTNRSVTPGVCLNCMDSLTFQLTAYDLVPSQIPYALQEFMMMQ